MVRPDYIQFKNQSELYHFGMPHRSGRYPYGSGNRPYQDREAKRAAKREKNISIGRERLNNRIARANKIAQVDKYSKKTGWENAIKSGEANVEAKKIKDISNEILSDDDRTAALGRYTNIARKLDIALTSTAATSLFVGGSAALVLALEAPIATMALPAAAAAIVAKSGYDYYRKTKY